MLNVYSRSGCAYCKLAKEFLTDHDLEFTEYEIDKNISRDEVVNKFPHLKTLPIIEQDETKEVIGSWTELVDWYWADHNNQ